MAQNTLRKMVCTEIVHTLRFFDICGFFTGSSTTPKYHRITLAIAVWQIFLAIILTIHVAFKVLQFYILLGIIDGINEFLHYLTLLCTYWIIFINSYLDRHIVNSFWSKYSKVYLKDVGNGCLFPLMVIEFFFVKFITIAIFVYSNDIPIVMMLPYLYLSYIVQLKVFHYIFHLRILRFELTHLVHELKSSSKWSASHRTINRIIHIRYLHDSIHELIDRMNDIHSLANVAALLCQFSSLLWTTNWISLHIEFFTYTSLSRKSHKSIVINDDFYCNGNDVIGFSYIYLVAVLGAFDLVCVWRSR